MDPCESLMNILQSITSPDVLGPGVILWWVRGELGWTLRMEFHDATSCL